MHRNAAAAAWFLGLGLAGASLAGCAPSSPGTSSTAAASDRPHSAGSLAVAGSTALLPLVEDAAGTYQDRHENVQISVFAIVTHPSASVKNLSKQQLRDIFSGKAATWSRLGGPDQKIAAVDRPRSSGTRAVKVRESDR